MEFGRKNGFSLVEAMVYITLLTVVFLSVLSLFIWANRSKQKTEAISEAANNGQRAVEMIASEIRQAESIYYPTSTTTQISLKTKTGVPAGEEYTYVDFYLCGTMLCEKREGQEAFPITSGEVAVSTFNLTYISTSTAPAVRISLALDYADYDSRSDIGASYSVYSTAYLRSN